MRILLLELRTLSEVPRDGNTGVFLLATFRDWKHNCVFHKKTIHRSVPSHTIVTVRSKGNKFTMQAATIIDRLVHRRRMTAKKQL